jgi:hypothetical protein
MREEETMVLKLEEAMRACGERSSDGIAALGMMRDESFELCEASQKVWGAGKAELYSKLVRNNGQSKRTVCRRIVVVLIGGE